MNIWLYIIAMAVIQGITEFLPVSSSGHLALLAAIFGFNAEKSQTLGIMLHAGSLIAIVVFYWKILIGFVKPKQWRLGLMIILGSIPAGLVGVALEATGLAEKLFDNMMMTGFAFLITATLLRLSEKPKLIVRPVGEADAEPTLLEKITVRQTIVIGLAQMVAIIPGISRSGSTITSGILTGVNREAAGTFSFLLAVPVIAGAVFVHLLKIILTSGMKEDVTSLQLATGLIISMGVSYWALSLLTRLIKRGKLSVFSWYLYILGAGVILWQVAAMVRKVH